VSQSLGYVVIVGVNDSGNLVTLNPNGTKNPTDVSRREFKRAGRGGE
jgi:hypothetical protein